MRSIIKACIIGHRHLTDRRSRPRSRKSLLIAASVGALAVAVPGVATGPAYAQALPAGCVDGNDNIAVAGETVNCVVAGPGTIGPIVTTC